MSVGRASQAQGIARTKALSVRKSLVPLGTEGSHVAGGAESKGMMWNWGAR